MALSQFATVSVICAVRCFGSTWIILGKTRFAKPSFRSAPLRAEQKWQRVCVRGDPMMTGRRHHGYTMRQRSSPNEKMTLNKLVEAPAFFPNTFLWV
ncbi:hypothetical protein EDB92DRAFT_1891157 [Lactarius akahatsu]|uniref:Uncharacterized protein n=1 Tax=Lactarius akahatsu TaxID=416441 RepID=A0AAD4LBG9_9AGAM|nr:hypothetical protein EDB92DRAFT_1891157 [Lactarius akahatsu]